MKYAVVVLLLMVCVVAYGQQVSVSDQIVAFAMKNIQQDGNFYFLSFPVLPGTNGIACNEFWGGMGNGDPNYSPTNFRPKFKAENAQVILRVLAGFEKTKRAEVATFQVVRDQEARNACPMIHGIFLKAKPVRGAK